MAPAALLSHPLSGVAGDHGLKEAEKRKEDEEEEEADEEEGEGEDQDNN